MKKRAQPTDWKTEPLPQKHVTLRLNRRFSSREMEPIRRGLVPQVMEDKWFVYWDDALFFHRSWTGYCIYVVRFVPEGEDYRMLEADVNRNPEQYGETDDAKDAEMISYLIDVLLLHREAELPSDEEEELESPSRIGRATLGEHPDDE